MIFGGVIWLIKMQWYNMRSNVCAFYVSIDGIRVLLMYFFFDKIFVIVLFMRNGTTTYLKQSYGQMDRKGTEGDRA